MKKEKSNLKEIISHRLTKLNNIKENGYLKYPYKYDRRHDFSLVLAHKFNEKWDIGATWVYGTGNAMTFPQAVYFGALAVGLSCLASYYLAPR